MRLKVLAGVVAVAFLAACATFKLYKVKQVDVPNRAVILKNGLRVVVNPDPNVRTTFVTIRYAVGSAHDPKEKKGLAHFLEHLCFNGTEHFPPGTLIPYFESIGLEFGADLNAFTSFDQTAYMLFLPDTEEATIDKALTVLSDYAFRASLLQEEIDKERGVVLEESSSGKNAFQRVRDKLWPRLFEGSRFAQRLPVLIAGAVMLMLATVALTLVVARLQARRPR